MIQTQELKASSNGHTLCWLAAFSRLGELTVTAKQFALSGWLVESFSKGDAGAGHGLSATLRRQHCNAKDFQ